MTQTLTLVYDVGQKLVTSREWPNWSADSEFRAARTTSAGDRP